MSVAEDIKYVFQSIISNRIVYTDSKLYYYRYNENSITNTTKVYYYNTMETYKYICDNIQNDNLKNLMKCRMWIYLFSDIFKCRVYLMREIKSS